MGHAAPDWVLLDRFVFRRPDDSHDGEAPATSAEGHTSSGETFSLSFRLAAPPSASLFYLHWPHGARPENGGYFDIVASHRNAILFSQISFAYPEKFPFCLCTQDLFIYRVCADPTLTLLPPPFAEQQLDQSLPLDETFIPDLESVGILCSGDGQDLAVAHLTVNTTRYSWRDVVASGQLNIFYSSTMEWQVRDLPILCDDDVDVFEFRTWFMHGVVAFGTCLCWVDYRVGVLFFNLFEECHQVTHVGFPFDDDDGDHDRTVTGSDAYMDIGLTMDDSVDDQKYMNMYRSICVVESEGGPLMKFVDVTPLGGYAPYPCSGDFKVTCWTLLITEGKKMVWQKDTVIRSDELSLNTFIPIPHEPLKFPLVSIDKPHIIYFGVRGLWHESSKIWLVTVDTISRTVQSVLPYHDAEEDHYGHDDGTPKRKCHHFKNFLPTTISKFFTAR